MLSVLLLLAGSTLSAIARPANVTQLTPNFAVSQTLTGDLLQVYLEKTRPGHFCYGFGKTMDNGDVFCFEFDNDKKPIFSDCKLIGHRRPQCTSPSSLWILKDQEVADNYSRILVERAVYREFRDAFVPDELILADHAQPFVRKIRAGFILLQAGLALGLIKDCINIMDEVEPPLGHINRYLPQQPVQFKELFSELERETMALARDPFDPDDTYWRKVVALRLRAGDASVAAAHAAMLHCGARGYLKGHRSQRRLREAYFVAIVTPATKQLKKMLADMAH